MSAHASPRRDSVRGMAVRRSCLLVLTPGLLALVGCATATEPRIGNADASPSPDARPGIDAAPGADASIDGPTTGSCTMAFTGMLASWDFTSEPGTQAMTAVHASAPGVTAGGVQRAAALTAVSGLNSINSNNWPSAAQLDATKYYAFSVTPPSGCTLSIASVAIDAKASGTGPASAVIATSADAYTQKGTVATSAPGTVTVTVTAATGAVELRVFGYAAPAAAGTFRLQNTLAITGSLQ